MIYAVLRRGRLFHRFLGWFFTAFKRAVEHLLQTVGLKLIGLPVKLSAVISQKAGNRNLLAQISKHFREEHLACRFVYAARAVFPDHYRNIFVGKCGFMPVYLGSHFSYFSLVASYCRKRLTIPAWIPIK